MRKQWQRLSFPELYVGAIRLYDLGYRNDAVYWFYTAQYRARQVSVVLNPSKVGSVGDPGFSCKRPPRPLCKPPALGSTDTHSAIQTV